MIARLWVLVAGLEHVADIKPLGLKCGSKWFFAAVVDMFDLTQLLDAGLLVAWRRRLATRPSTLEDVVPNSYCVRSAVLVVKYIAPAPAASARLVSIGCAGAYALPEAPGSLGGRCELNLWRGWYCWTCVAYLGRRVHPEFCRDAWSRCQRLQESDQCWLVADMRQ